MVRDSDEVKIEVLVQRLKCRLKGTCNVDKEELIEKEKHALYSIKKK